MAEVRARELTGQEWSVTDEDGDTVVVYTPDVHRCAVGVQRRGAKGGRAALLNAEALDKLLDELLDRRARMPGRPREAMGCDNYDRAEAPEIDALGRCICGDLPGDHRRRSDGPTAVTPPGERTIALPEVGSGRQALGGDGAGGEVPPIRGIVEAPTLLPSGEAARGRACRRGCCGGGLALRGGPRG